MLDTKRNEKQNHGSSSSKDFRLFLNEELVRRCKKNPRFSVRAFAKQLGIENSALSKILSGKRALTPQMVARLGEKLNLGPQELSQFAIVPFNNSLHMAEANFQQLTLDQFAVIADWYHYAIHELVKLPSCRSDSKWISKKLGITVAEASTAVERLLRLGYLEKNKLGRLINKSGPLTTTGSNFTSVAFRKLQRQILEKGIDALEMVPLEKRNQTSMTVAISTKRLEQANEKIKVFRRELSDFLESDPKSLDAVYHLGISLYPVTQDE